MGRVRTELSPSARGPQGQLLFERVAIPQIKDEAERAMERGPHQWPKSRQAGEHMDFRQRFCLVRDQSPVGV